MREFYLADHTDKIIRIYYKIFHMPGRMGYNHAELRRIFISHLKEIGYEVVEEQSFTTQIREDVIVEKRPDIIVNDQIVIEIKTSAGSKEQGLVRPQKHRDQVKLYLLLGKWPVGLCFYFGNENPVFFRIDEPAFQNRGQK